MSANPKLTDGLSEDVMTIGELWEAVQAFAVRRVSDNQKYNGDYPLETRMCQMETLHTLINAIDEFHREYSDN